MPDVTPKFTVEDTPTAKRPPGRPKGTTNAAKSTAAISADVTKALATLDSAYNLIATGLVVFGYTATAEDWISSAEQLRKSNADALNASPKLASYIANAGSAGGSATFLVTHAMAFASLAGTLRTEIIDKRADKLLETDPVPDDPTKF